MKLVIAEKPSVAASIAKVIGAKNLPKIQYVCNEFKHDIIHGFQDITT